MRIVLGVSLIATVAAVYLWGHADGSAGKKFRFPSQALAAESQPELSPVKARPRDAYFPNSEDLGPDEMRVIACGTGMPTARPSQAAASARSKDPDSHRDPSVQRDQVVTPPA